VAVAGESMTPALQPDDFLVLHAGPPRPEKAVGQIVAVHDPRPTGDGRLFLKRIVGVPGESLRVGGGSVQVNGRPLDEPYASGETPYEQHRGINRLEDGQYFLLGDNREASTDSRDFGPVPAGAIVGTAVLRYWPLRRAGRLTRAPRRFAATVEGGEHAPHGHGAPAPARPATQPTTQPLPWVERTPEG
jgi:signal peptidase I